MGRPIKKKWFTVKDGAVGDLSLTTAAGVEPIIAQKGTGVYDVASGRVKLVNKMDTPLEGEAILLANGSPVSKISQYRMYYFDPAKVDVQWRNGAADVLVTLAPPLTTEGESPAATATASATVTSAAIASIAVTDGGGGYGAAPAVTVSAPDGTSATLGTIVVDEGTGANDPGTVTSIAVSGGGSGYTSAPAVVITGTNTGAASATAVLTDGVVTSITIDVAGTGYGIADIGATIDAVTLTQATATAVLDGDVVDTIGVDVAGEGYVAATVTVAAP